MRTPEDTRIEELERALRADTPVPEQTFRDAMDRRVQEGFPRNRRRPAWPRARTLGFAGAAASLVVAAGVAISLQGDDRRELELGSGGLAGSGDSESALRRSSPAQSAEPVPPGGELEPRRGDRAIERSASLTLAAPGDELDRVGDRIVAVADRYRGFVARSSVTSGDDEASGGTFELRIPSRGLRPAIRDLSALGHVRSRSQSGEDVTRQLASVRDRLAAARAERRSLLRRLERADTDSEAEAIRRRLDLVAREISGLRAQLRDRRERVAYAQVGVSLVKEDGDSGSSGGLDGTDDALHDALGSMSGALNLTVRALGVALPLTLLAGIGWVMGQALLRRRREAALF